MIYKCKDCEIEVKADSIDEIIKNKKLCKSCNAKERKEKKGIKGYCEVCKEEFYLWKEQDYNKNHKKYCSEKCREKKYKEDRSEIKREREITCAVCGNLFIGNQAKYCSKECKSKGIQNEKFYKGLKQANTAIAISKVKVFGANSQKGKNFINDKSRKEI